MKAFGNTNVGAVRSSNQDCFACGVFEDGAVWGIVCDGMGGANGGDVASRCAVDIIREMLIEQYEKISSERQIKKLFAKAVEKANRAILDRTKEEPTLAGMGTTLVGAIVRNKKAYIAHAGDSRAYIISDTARQVTKDHSVVQQLVDSGRITPEQALSHPHRNIITRAIGVGPAIEIDFAVHKFDQTSRLLLCSDGLTNCVSDELLAAISAENPAQELADRYIEAANANGGYDNITAVIISE